MFDDADQGRAPFRVVGVFTERAVRAGDLMEALEKAVEALPDDDPGGAITLLPFGAPDEPLHGFKAVMRPGDEARPGAALVRVFKTDDPRSPHRALCDKLVQLGDEQLTSLALGASEGAASFVEIAMGQLDHRDRIEPFLSFVKLVARTADGVLVDPAAAVVGDDLEDWSQAARLSLTMEMAIPALGE